MFLEINRRYQARLKKYLKRYLDDRIEDVVQETFFRLFRLLEGDKEVCLETGSLHPLIFFIATKVAIDDVRSESRRRRLHNAFALFPLDGPRPADADAIAAEMWREVHRALTKLPRLNRRVAVIYFVRRNSIREVARRTRTSLTGAKSRIARTRELLMTHLEPYWKGADHDL